MLHSVKKEFLGEGAMRNIWLGIIAAALFRCAAAAIAMVLK
jgi:hypothetical protein